MFTSTLPRLSRLASSIRSARSARSLVRPALYALLITVSALGIAQRAPAAPTDAKSFFTSMVGEWVGVCKQSTDGKQADDKYFHVVVKQAGPNNFISNFEYYRLDDHTGKPLNIGTSSINTTISANGAAQNHIIGQGTMMVDLKPKQQKHDLKEVLCSTSTGLQGTGSGSLSVSGMPLGLGKNGKIKNASSSYSIRDGVLNIHQNIRAGFKALFFSKNFDVVADYSAQRGTDIASVIGKPLRVSSAR